MTKICYKCKLKVHVTSDFFHAPSIQHLPIQQQRLFLCPEIHVTIVKPHQLCHRTPSLRAHFLEEQIRLAIHHGGPPRSFLGLRQFLGMSLEYV